jgi:hypothetical protein
VDARRRDCDDAPAIVPLHGVGHGAEAKLPGDGSAPCLPSQSRKVYRITLKYPEARLLAWSATPDCPGGSTGTSRPFAALRTKGAPLRGGSLLWTTWTIRTADAQHGHLTTPQQIATDLERHRHHHTLYPPWRLLWQEEHTARRFSITSSPPCACLHDMISDRCPDLATREPKLAEIPRYPTGQAYEQALA